MSPSVTGNGGTIFTPPQNHNFANFFPNLIIKTHHKKLSFGMFLLPMYKMHIKKIEKQRFFGNGGTGRNYNYQICERLVNKNW